MVQPASCNREATSRARLWKKAHSSSSVSMRMPQLTSAPMDLRRAFCRSLLSMARANSHTITPVLGPSRLCSSSCLKQSNSSVSRRQQGNGSTAA